MRQGNRSSRIGKVALALILSFLLGTGTAIDGFATALPAYAEGAAAASPSEAGQGGAEGSTAADSTLPGDAGTSSAGAASEGPSGQTGDSGAPSLGSTGGADQLSKEVELGAAPKNLPSNDEGSSAAHPSDQVEGKLPLGSEGAPATVGAVVYEGLRYEVQPDGATAKVAGASTALSGDVVVPAMVRSGADEYRVTGLSAHALSGCAEVRSVSLPATVQEVDASAFDGCAKLASITVNRENPKLSSHAGMLFDAQGATLLRCPQGKQGPAALPQATASVLPEAFEGCAGVTGFQVAEGNQALSVRDGVLCSADGSVALLYPAGAGDAAVLAPEVREVEAKAFAACALSSLASLGTVSRIAEDAFSEETQANAVVALPAGEDYDARKKVWEDAGFSHFAEPAAPGDAAGPEAGDAANPDAEGGADASQPSGLAYTLLDDYTLSVAWQGKDDPEAELVIPASAQLGGVSYRVSAVAAGGFSGRASLVSVQLPATVESVGEAAFAGCANLAGVTLPEGLRTIGIRAFEATSLSDVRLPASVASVGERAFAGCSSLARVVALGVPAVAGDALADCAGVTVYCPFSAEGAYPWNVGLPASGNHLAPYGVQLAAEALKLEVGQQADLFEGGLLEAPEGVEASYAYAAKPLSVDAGQVSAKAPGASEVAVTLTLDGEELARASRAVEVTAAPQTQPEGEAQGAEPPAETPAEAPQAEFINQTVALTANEEPTPLASTSDLTFMETTIGGVAGYAVRATSVSAISGDLVIPAEYNGKPVLSLLSRSFYNATNLISVTIPDSVVQMGGSDFVGCTRLESVIVGAGITMFPPAVFYDCNALRKLVIRGRFSFEPGSGSAASVLPNSFIDSGSVLIRPFTMSNDPEPYRQMWVSWGLRDEAVKNASTVTFDTQGGSSAPNVQYVPFGGKVEKPQDPTRPHYFFGGWWTTSNYFGDPWDFETPMPQYEQCATLYAKWIPYTYTISFDGNGASSGAAPAQVTASYDQDVAMPANTFVKSGYTFTGWNTKADGTGTPFAAEATATKPNLTDQNNGSVTLYAQWRENTSAEQGTSGTCNWSIDTAGHLTISPANGSQGTLGSFTNADSVPWYPHRASITSATVLPGVSADEGLANMFYKCSSMTSVDLSGLNTEAATTMTEMFAGCSALTSIDLSKFKTANVVRMNNMFAECVGLTALDLSSFNTSRVAKMNHMFFNCTSLGTLNLSSFDTSLVDDMRNMFGNCSQLVSLDVSHFKTAKVWSMHGMFSGCSALTSLNLSNFDTSKVSTMESMFSGCAALTALDLSSFNTPNLTSMTNMFFGCNGLTSLNVTSFNTEKVTSMYGTFWNCSNLTQLDVTGFDTRNVTNTGNMFAKCNKLTSLDVSGFDMSKVGCMGAMFHSCSSLTSLDVSNFRTDSATDMNTMFFGCRSLTSLDVSGFNTSIVKSIHGMFTDCRSLTSLDVSGFDTSQATSLNNMFRGCTSLTSLDVSSWDTSKVTAASAMFKDCTKLASLDVSNFETSQMTSMPEMFRNCGELTSLDVSRFNTSKVTDIGFMFYGCKKLTSLDLRGFDTSALAGNNAFIAESPGLLKVTLPASFKKMFGGGLFGFKGDLYVYGGFEKVESSSGCTGTVHLMTEAAVAAKDKWTTAGYTVVDGTATAIAKGTSGGCTWIIDAAGALTVFPTNGESGTLASSSTPSHVGWDGYRAQIISAKILPGVISASGLQNCLFYNCSNMTEVDLSGFDSSDATSLDYMFSGCASLTTLDVFNLNTESVTSMWLMFDGCEKLGSLDLSNFDTANVYNMASMFNNCSALTSLDVSSFDTSQVTSMHSMFSNCHSLTSLDVTHFDTSQVMNMNSMFGSCSGLTALDVSNFNTFLVTDMKSMFEGCSKLAVLDVSGFDTSHVTTMRWMFKDNSALTSLDLSNFDTSSVTEMLHMFMGDTHLDSITISDRFSNVLSYAFSDCTATVYVYGAPTTIDAEKGAYTGTVHLMSSEASAAESKWTNAGYTVVNHSNGTQKDNLLIYTPKGNGTCSVKARQSFRISGHLAIPREIFWSPTRESLRVTEIDASGFDGCAYLTSVSIPDSVTKIGAQAFSGCKSLASVVIPQGITEIPDSVFALCSGLKSVSLPSSVTSIGKAAFAFCEGLKSIDLPDNLVSLGDQSFSSCTALASVDIPQGLTSIGSSTFANSGLTHMVIPAGIVSMGNGVFQGCASLSEILLLREDGLTVGSGMLSSSSTAEVYVKPGYKAAAASSVTGAGASDLIGRMTELSAGTIRVLKGASGSTRTVEPPADRVAPSLIDMPYEWSAPAEANLAVSGSGNATVTYGAAPYDLTGELVYYDAAGTRTVAASSSGTVAPSTSHKVTFMLQKPGEAAPTTVATKYSTTGPDGKQYVDDPGASEVYGYTFSGWTDRATHTKLAFTNGKAEVTANATAVGTYEVRVNVTIPLTAEVKFDAAATAQPGALRFENRTIADVKVSSVTGTRDAEGSAALVPDQTQRESVKAQVALGDAFSSPLTLDGATALQPNVVLAAAAQNSSTNLAGTVSFNFKEAGAQVNYQPNQGTQPFASLTWTVGL